MNSHEELKFLSSYIDDQLKSDQQIKIKTHLEFCPTCQNELKQLISLKSSIKKLPQKKIPAALITSIEARAMDQFRKRSWMDWFFKPTIWVPAAAFSLGLLAMTFWLAPTRTTSDEIPIDSILAAHHRYLEESPIPSSDLSSGAFSAKLAAYEGPSE